MTFSLIAVVKVNAALSLSLHVSPCPAFDGEVPDAAPSVP